MKKFLALLLGMLLTAALLLTGCAPAAQTEPEATEAPAAEETPAPADEQETAALFTPGTYTASVYGNNGYLDVQVVLDADKIVSVDVPNHAETRFLAKHEYGTAAELESHKEKSTGRISELEQERTALRNQLRTATRREDAPAVESLKSRIKEVSSEIKTLRQEVKLCDGIEARSALMEQNLEQLQQEREIERKEEEQHELFRRGGRSGRPSELERR